jgi:hypothetical protein
MYGLAVVTKKGEQGRKEKGKKISKKIKNVQVDSHVTVVLLESEWC